MGKKKDINKKPKFDIFKEASNAVIKKTIIPQELVLGENALPDVKNTPAVGETFADLEKSMDTVHAKKFNLLLHTLPDREFVRVYLKALEYFKPKIVREIGGGKDTGDTTINIQINR